MTFKELIKNCESNEALANPYNIYHLPSEALDCMRVVDRKFDLERKEKEQWKRRCESAEKVLNRKCGAPCVCVIKKDKYFCCAECRNWQSIVKEQEEI